MRINQSVGIYVLLKFDIFYRCKPKTARGTIVKQLGVSERTEILKPSKVTDIESIIAAPVGTFTCNRGHSENGLKR